MLTGSASFLMGPAKSLWWERLDSTPLVTAMLGGEVFDGTKITFTESNLKAVDEFKTFSVKAEAQDASENMSTRVITLKE